MKRTLFSVLFTLFAVAIFAQAPDAAPKDPTVLVSYTILRNWGTYQTGSVVFQTNCFSVFHDGQADPTTCLLDRVVSELTQQGKLKGLNLSIPARNYVEITGWTILDRDIALSTRDSRWGKVKKE